MAIDIYRKHEQADGQFNGGEILEKKPIGFQQDDGPLRPYSNLFYWSHAWSYGGSTIGDHPHQGFEIMSYMLTGKNEQFTLFPEPGMIYSLFVMKGSPGTDGQPF